MMNTKRYDPKQCAVCYGNFRPRNPAQRVCSFDESPSCRGAYERQRKERDAERAKKNVV